jgi:hypothetical protein
MFTSLKRPWILNGLQRRAGYKILWVNNLG